MSIKQAGQEKWVATLLLPDGQMMPLITDGDMEEEVPSYTQLIEYNFLECNENIC